MFLSKLFSLTNPRYLGEEYRSKAILLNNTSLFTIGMCIVITIGCFIFNFRQGKIIMSSCTLALTGIFYYFRRGGGLVVCSNLYLSVAAVVILLSCYYSGLFTSPVLYWSIILPLYAFWLLGTRYGFMWLGIALLMQLTILTFGTLNFQAARPFDFYAPGNVGLLYVLVVLLITNVAIFCYDFETGKIRALFNVEMEKTALSETLYRLEQTKLKLEKAEKHKDLFLSQMSHEMRTPMNAIVGLTNLMLEQQNENRDVQIVNQSARNLLGIIDDILDITRVQSGKFSFNYRDVDTASFFEATAKPLSLRAMEKNLYFDLVQQPGLPEQVSTDPVRLAQIINNLAGNGIKFTSTGGVRVTIGYEPGLHNKPGFDGLTIQVTDTGIGIPKEKQELVFEVFQQADDAVYRKYGGTGLGLSITKQLVEAAGGTIAIESEPYRGTTIQVMFPVKQAMKPGTAAPKTQLNEHVRQALNNLSILLVDDYDVNRMVTIKTIHSEAPGMQIDEAYNGQEAIDLLARKPYHLVLMDVQMPVMDGLEATRWLRADKDKRIRETRIIGLTSYAMKDDEAQCFAAGMNDYLSKPFEKYDLLMKMYKLVAPKNNA
ncbi:MAG: response regulator [Dinghuibacter sp.]|nr:response regulator [Dinghuibacter sp.]